MLVRTSDATWQAYNKYGGNSLYSCTSPCPPGNPQALPGRVLGLVQPALRRHDPAGRRPLVPVLRRVPDDPVHRAQRLRRQLHEPGRRRRQRRAPAQPRRDPLQRPRRVLVGAASGRTSRRPATPASASRSSAATRCSGRRAGSRAAPTARRRSTGRSRPTRTRTSTRRPIRWSGPAPGATRASARRATAAAPENSLTGQLFIVNSGSSDIKVPAAYKNLRLWRNTAVANLGAGQTPDARARRADARLRVGRRRRQRLPPARAVQALVDDGQRRRVVHRLRQHACKPAPRQTHNLTMYRARQRRAGVRRGHGPVGVGPRHHQRVGDNGPPAGGLAGPGDAAGDGQPVRRHGRAARRR